MPEWLAEVPNGQFYAGHRPVLYHIGEGATAAAPLPLSPGQAQPGLRAVEPGAAPPLHTVGRAWWRVGRLPSSYCTGSSKQGWAPTGLQHLSRALGSPHQAILQAGRPAWALGAGVVLVQGLGSMTRPGLMAAGVWRAVPCTCPPHAPARRPAHLRLAQRCPS